MLRQWTKNTRATRPVLVTIDLALLVDADYLTKRHSYEILRSMSMCYMNGCTGVAGVNHETSLMSTLASQSAASPSLLFH